MIEGKISYKLYHSLQNYVMSILLKLINNSRKVTINCHGFSGSEGEAEGEAEGGSEGGAGKVGCGLSCGVDSLCCLQDYYFNYDGPYKLTHVTNFNSGGSGNQVQFNKRLNNVRGYLKSTDLELLVVNTNFRKINTIKSSKDPYFLEI